MPFKSKAQRRKFAELLIKGDIDPETYEEWNRETGGKKLPERVRPKTKQPRGRPAARKTGRKTATKRADKRGGRKRVARKRRASRH